MSQTGNVRERTNAVHAWAQYEICIPFFSISSFCSTKYDGRAAPAHRKSASGQRPPKGLLAAFRAASDSASESTAKEYALRICAGFWRASYQTGQY